eukprot:c54340_g1_i1 orf=2-280(-)
MTKLNGEGEGSLPPNLYDSSSLVREDLPPVAVANICNRLDCAFEGDQSLWKKSCASLCSPQLLSNSTEEAPATVMNQSRLLMEKGFSTDGASY